MKTLEKGQDKIKRICEVLKKETLEPAQIEAEKIIKEAKERADQILLEAKKQAKKTIDEAKLSIEQERNVFHSSLAQASKQSLEALKQAVEQKLFNGTIDEQVIKESSAAPIVAKLINAIVEGIEKEGVSKDFTVFVSKNTSPDEVARSLAGNVLNSLKAHPIQVGTFAGGVQVKLNDKKLALVITDKEISEFLKNYARKDFREFIFNGS
ncbi:MAG: V-type ATP synthase subunit E [Parachlamydiaceae bacterium]|nr:V-type ATP synthase subunit E [Parachlamydiaceae bacterium]